jgi:hypothetical protein
MATLLSIYLLYGLNETNLTYTQRAAVNCQPMTQRAQGSLVPAPNRAETAMRRLAR